MSAKNKTIRRQKTAAKEQKENNKRILGREPGQDPRVYARNY